MKRILPAFCVLATLSNACTATIDEGRSGDPAVGASGPGASGGSNTGGSTGTGVGAGAGVGPGATDAGLRVLRRLNRTEYNNTVRDLLGTSLRPGDKLPDDETVDGFDTVGEALSFSLTHVETLEQAAAQLIDELYALPEGDARRAAVLSCKLESGAEATCARQVVSSLARRAFRRPVPAAEVDRLLQLVEKVKSAGETYEEALKAALRAILISPSFLYMVERGTLEPGVVRALDDHELATRLSYFLWSSMPDAALFAAADAGGLAADAAKLTDEVRRMLTDPKAAALTRDFVGQWLTLRRLSLVEPDKQTFPSYDVSLRDAAVRETELFIGALFEENAPAQSLLTASFTFANQRLAQHYQLPATGAEFVRVDLRGSERVGILSQASFLMANSHPGFTSPTKRGAWVLEQLLCSAPPPVPADLMVDPLAPPAEGETVRQKLEAHRAQPTCAGCHAVMDPIGLSLEHFDAIGAYRATENGAPVDASGVLNGTPFVGVHELVGLLRDDPRLASCFAQQLLTYAAGRSFHTSGGHDYAEALVQGRAGMRDVIEAVAQSDAFRTRRGE